MVSVLIFMMTGLTDALANPPPACEPLRWGVHSSDVTQSSVFLWAGLSPGTAARFRVTGAKTTKPRLTEWEPVPGTGMFSQKVSGLQAGSEYAFSLEREKCVAVGDGGESSGRFRTLPADASLEPVRFIWGADLGGQNLCRKKDGGYAILEPMIRENPALFVSAGDIIYGDTGCNEEGGNVQGPVTVAQTEEEFRGKYLYQFEDAGLRRFLAATATLATPDDHEVGDDFSGRNHPLAKAGLSAFRQAFPIEAPASERGRIYRSRRLGRVAEIFILDTRQYRTPNLVKDGPEKTMLGAAQLRWLLDGLKTSRATWKIVVSSVPISFPTGYPAERNGRDGWTGYFPPSEKTQGDFPGKGTGFMHEFHKIRDHIARVPVRNVVFLTADAHRAQAIEYPDANGKILFREFISGPLSAFPGWPAGLDPELKPRSLFERIGVFNYGVVDVSPKKLAVRLADQGGKTLFEHAIVPL